MSKDQIDIDIFFHQPEACWKAGEQIVGDVIVHSNTQLKVKAVKLKIYGTARVSWSVQKSYTKATSSSVSVKNCQVLVDHELILKSNDLQEGLLRIGKNKFPFKFDLSKSLPPSFNGKWGNIHYVMTATVEKAWKNSVIKDKEFTVNGYFDLNDENEILRPVGSKIEFEVSRCCCNVGAVTIEFRVARKGFVCGEIIPIHVEIINGSSRKLVSSRVALIQTVKYRADDRIKRINTVISSLSKGETGPRKTEIWENEALPIPKVPVTTKCKNIHIQYSVVFTITPSGWTASEKEIVANIIIGSEPLHANTVQKFLKVCDSRRSSANTSRKGSILSSEGVVGHSQLHDALRNLPLTRGTLRLGDAPCHRELQARRASAYPVIMATAPSGESSQFLIVQEPSETQRRRDRAKSLTNTWDGSRRSSFDTRALMGPGTVL